MIVRAWSETQDHQTATVAYEDGTTQIVQWDDEDAEPLRAWVDAGGAIEYVPPPPPEPDPVEQALERADAPLIRAIAEALRDHPAVAAALEQQS